MAQHITPTNATETFAEMADSRIVKKVQDLIDSGKAEWIYDPQVDGVLGLVKVGDPTCALVVLYTDPLDFECAGDTAEAAEQGWSGDDDYVKSEGRACRKAATRIEETFPGVVFR